MSDQKQQASYDVMLVISAQPLVTDRLRRVIEGFEFAIASSEELTTDEPTLRRFTINVVGPASNLGSLLDDLRHHTDVHAAGLRDVMSLQRADLETTWRAQHQGDGHYPRAQHAIYEAAE